MKHSTGLVDFLFNVFAAGLALVIGRLVFGIVDLITRKP